MVNASGDHTLLGFEALVRWNNPKFGNVSPAKFIPVAEDARLIVDIGEWVLRKACKDAMQWPETTNIAVNISVDQLTSAAFVETVIAALHDSGLPAWRLELESNREHIPARWRACDQDTGTDPRAWNQAVAR